MSYGIPSDEVAEDYKRALEDLTMNSRYEISNLTVIAKENTEHALAISEALKNHIKQVGHLSSQFVLVYLVLISLCVVLHVRFRNILLTIFRPPHRKSSLRSMCLTLSSRMLAHLTRCFLVDSSTRRSWKHMPW